MKVISHQKIALANGMSKFLKLYLLVSVSLALSTALLVFVFKMFTVKVAVWKKRKIVSSNPVQNDLLTDVYSSKCMVHSHNC